MALALLSFPLTSQRNALLYRKFRIMSCLSLLEYGKYHQRWLASCPNLSLRYFYSLQFRSFRMSDNHYWTYFWSRSANQPWLVHLFSRMIWKVTVGKWDFQKDSSSLKRKKPRWYQSMGGLYLINKYQSRCASR